MDIEAKIQGREEGDFFLSVVTVSELLHGVHRSGERSVRTHAEIRAELASDGAMIGPHDLWIAAAAVAYGLDLATTNVREFAGVPGLEVAAWG